ncbi:hypothetical protein GGR53DRAFT_465976 [Hypoxylon sp. FL1150]|nr:hypothetical protein GGR53DRAFT_465976 [Hypoxylon sp. FL1150]
MEGEATALSSIREQNETPLQGPDSHLLPRSRSETPLQPTENTRRTTKLRRFVEYPRTLRKHSGFVYLTVLAMVMITINIVQAALIQRISSYGWIVGFPVAVFGSFSVVLIAWAVRDRRALATTWQRASWSERTAWTGVILSILVPIIVCEFVYLPLVAVRDYRSVKWSSSVRAEKNQIPPAILLVPDSLWITFHSHGTSAEAYIEYDTDTYSEGIVSPVGYFTGHTFNGTELTLPWLSFTPNMTDPGAQVSILRWYLAVNLTYNSTGPLGDNTPADYLPYMKAFLYDSTLPLNFSELFNRCGPPWGNVFAQEISIPAVNAGSGWPVYVDVLQIDDKAGDLATDGPGFECSPTLENYKYYTGRAPPLTWDTSMGNECDVGRNASATPCPLILSFQLSSPLVSVQTSRRGSHTLKILIDEGSILGAILFITWFFGIFVI